MQWSVAEKTIRRKFRKNWRAFWKDVKLDEAIFYLAVFSLPFENFFFAPSAGWATITPLILLVYFLLNLKQVPELLKKYRFLVGLVIVALVFAGANLLFYNFNFDNTRSALISAGLGGVVFFSLAIYYDKTRNLKKLVPILLVAYSITFMIGLIEWLTIALDLRPLYDFFGWLFRRNYLRYGRVQFFFTEPSFTSMHLFGILLPMFFLTKDRRILWLIGGFLVVSILSGSSVRIILDLAIVAVLISVVWMIKLKRYILLVLIAVALGALGTFAYATNERVRDIISGGIYADGSFASRWFRINASLKGYSKDPLHFLFGYGLGNSLIPLRAGYAEAEAEYQNSYRNEVEQLGDPNYNDDAVSYSFYIRLISEFGFIIFVAAAVYLILLLKNSTFPYKWELFLTILYLYVQYESYAFYALWILVLTLSASKFVKFSRSEKTNLVKNSRATKPKLI